MTEKRPVAANAHRSSWACHPPPLPRALPEPVATIWPHAPALAHSSIDRQHPPRLPRRLSAPRAKRQTSSRQTAASVRRPAPSAFPDELDTTPDRTPATFSRTPGQQLREPQRTWFPRSVSAPVMSKHSPKNKVRRWDPANRRVTNWDGLRRDDELWFPKGDCLVHLHAKGQSQRGPSFRVPFQAIYSARCGPLFTICYAQISPVRQGDSTAPDDSILDEFPNTSKYEAFIPAPASCLRDEAFSWHLATRNFFAFLFLKPLVGLHLGQAIVDLRERLRTLRSEDVDIERDLHTYLEQIGYLDFTQNPDYALAVLYYAEQYQHRDLWIDAFAHCVGMSDSLSDSAEFKLVCQVTKALIARAYLEMDLHISRVTNSLRNFLEEELSATFLGLSKGARAHLDRFRSFLHSFYVDKFGYWPPPTGVAFSKSLYRSMYFDFRGLYEYLADPASTNDLTQQPPATGGICVLQNVQAFDARHKYESLPYPLCLIPDISKPHQRRNSQRGLLTLKLGTKEARKEHFLSTRNSLAAASNVKLVSPGSSALLRAFIKFERDWSSMRQEERVSLSDARKVRWLLIYGVLQKLISVIRAPPEVRNTDDPTYPLCALMIGVPPWKNEPRAQKCSPHSSPRGIGRASQSHIGERVLPAAPKSPNLSIHPDCDDDYFGTSRVDSLHRADSLTISAPLRIPVKESGLARHNSLRKLKNLALSSFVSRRSSAATRRSIPSFCEAVNQAPAYGQNLYQSDASSRPIPLAPSVLEPFYPDNASIGSTRLRTPTLEDFQLDPMCSFNAATDYSDANSPPPSPIWSSDASAPSSCTDSIAEHHSSTTPPFASFYHSGVSARDWTPESPFYEKSDRMTIATDLTRKSFYRPQSCESMTPSVRVGVSKVDIHSAVKFLHRAMPIHEDVAEGPTPISRPSTPTMEILPTLQELKLPMDERRLQNSRKPLGKKVSRSSMAIFNTLGLSH